MPKDVPHPSETSSPPLVIQSKAVVHPPLSTLLVYQRWRLPTLSRMTQLNTWSASNVFQISRRRRHLSKLNINTPRITNSTFPISWGDAAAAAAVAGKTISEIETRRTSSGQSEWRRKDRYALPRPFVVLWQLVSFESEFLLAHFHKSNLGGLWCSELRFFLRKLHVLRLL